MQTTAFLAFVNAIVVSTMFSSPVIAQLAPALQNVARFKVPACAGTPAAHNAILSRLDRLLSTEDKLVSLCGDENPQVPDAKTIEIADRSGNNFATIDLGDDNISDITADSGGHIYVLRVSASRQTYIQEFSTIGTLVKTVSAQRSWFKLVALNAGLFAVDSSGWVVKVGDPGIPVAKISSENVDLMKVAQLDGHRFAVIDSVEVVIDLVDVTAGTATNYSISDSETQRVKANYMKERSVIAGRQRGNTVILVAGSEGDLYCVLSGFRPEDGAPLLKFSANGVETSLPRIPMLKENGTAIIPEAMTISGGKIFVGDLDGNVSVYAL